MRAALSCAVLLLLVACASLRFNGAVALKIQCSVPDAAVHIDDVYVGRCSEWAVDGRFIKAGFRRFEFRHPDYFPHYQEVSLEKGDAVLLQPKLQQLLD